MHKLPLRCEPWVGEALGRCSPPFRHQVQHGQEEAAEGVGLLFGPLVLFYQDVKQTPRLQLGDVTQVTWEKILKFNNHSAECYSYRNYIGRKIMVCVTVFFVGKNPLHHLYDLEVAALNLICKFCPRIEQMAVP